MQFYSGPPMHIFSGVDTCTCVPRNAQRLQLSQTLLINLRPWVVELADQADDLEWRSDSG